MVTHSLMPRPAPLSEHVRTVLLPVAGCAVAEGTYCLMYGWGDTKGTILFYSILFSNIVYIYMCTINVIISNNQSKDLIVVKCLHAYLL